mmetsp:Transcript_32785/g.83205  ORF Transcript_32785/g.83205 Transcript_32785/m.83205 type:complete len:911 (-) Transcript_32785:492-3224(-)
MSAKISAPKPRGEIAELTASLQSLCTMGKRSDKELKAQKREVFRKVINYLTVGMDMSSLFPSMTSCANLSPDDIVLKKMLYLYITHYASQTPDLALLTINQLHKDCADQDPTVRGLALRSLCSLRLANFLEYVTTPVTQGLEDRHPYVRKTAAVCVAKLFDISPELVDDRGFLDKLRDMLSDANPMVVANALAALQEIAEVSGRDVLQMSSHTLFKLLAALNECTEWGQVFILDSLSSYETRDAKDAEKIVERVLPRLQHVNSAVVLSAIKVIMRMMDVVASDDLVKAWCKKMAPPLVTLLGTEPEVQYVALRNINLIVQKRPGILANEVKVFFCKYNDPIYVKMEKLEIMIKLASDKNIDQVLLEFKEYAQEVDVDFVRKAVRAIGRCAVVIDKAAEKCVNVLLELIATKVNYVVQEAVIVIKDIFRRYPNQYESIIATLCDNLDSLDEPEAKASMIWIIGEYAERIDNADELLESFLETFPEEVASVQLQLLTATVKLFLKRPNEAAQKMISLVLSCATNDTDNPDLRDRAYIYWRLLSTDPEAAKDVVLSEKPVIMDDSSNLDPLLLDKLLGQMATLASVYHKPADSFVSRQRLAVTKADELQGHKFEEEGDASTRAGQVSDGTASASAPTASQAMGDLLDLDAGSPTAAAPAGRGIDDLLGGLDLGSVPTGPPPPLPVVLADGARGVTVGARLIRHNHGIGYHVSITNSSQGPLDGLMIQTNKSSFGLSPANQVVAIPTLAPGAAGHAIVPMIVEPTKIVPGPPNAALQIALKTNQVGVLYFTDAISLVGLLEEGGAIDGPTFLSSWKALPPEAQQRLGTVVITDVEAAKAKLQAANLFVLAHRPVPGTPQSALYVTGRVAGAAGAQIMLELRVVEGQQGVDASFKSEKQELAQLAFEAVTHVLTA